MLPFKDRIRLWAIRLRYCYQTKVRHMDIDKSALVSFGTKLDKVNPRGIHIGAETYILKFPTPLLSESEHYTKFLTEVSHPSIIRE